MSALLAMGLGVIAFALFGIATDRHHEMRFGRRMGAAFARRCRLAAWLVLGAAFAGAVAAWGWVFGPIAWTGLAMAGAAASFLFLNLIPPPARASSGNRTRGR